jgi:alkylation response protein AidB-like acyl-CoA dehydrogenase
MDFSITDEQRDICETVEDLAREHLNESVFNDDESSRFPREKWDVCGACGIPGLPVPENYGGSGASMLTTALAVEALARTCTDEGLVFSLCAHMCTSIIPILQYGTEVQKEHYLSGLSNGKKIGANGSSEANAGSDLAAMKSKVNEKENGFLLNGSKQFVTNGSVADVIIIYAKHPDGLRMADISAFIVEKEFPGVSVGQHFTKMGLRTSPLCEIVLSDCTVSSDQLLGRERFGMHVFNQSMLWERIIMSAFHTGAMEQQLAIVTDYAKQRKQFGKRLIDYQDIATKLVNMKRSVETSKLLLYKQCWEYDNGKESLAEASLLKYHTAESKVHNSTDAVQIFGAYGYIKESLVEKQLRDSMAATIYSGTSEIQKKIITEGLCSNG